MKLPSSNSDSENTVILYRITDGYWRQHPYVSFSHDGKAGPESDDPGPTDGGKEYILPAGYTVESATGIIHDDLGQACKIEGFVGFGTERKGAGLPMLISTASAQVLQPTDPAAARAAGWTTEPAANNTPAPRLAQIAAPSKRYAVVFGYDKGAGSVPPREMICRRFRDLLEECESALQIVTLLTSLDARFSYYAMDSLTGEDASSEPLGEETKPDPDRVTDRRIQAAVDTVKAFPLQSIEFQTRHFQALLAAKTWRNSRPAGQNSMPSISKGQSRESAPLLEAAFSTSRP
jgi:hypothetical protein